MELPGVEPGSKQGTKLLSTCLACGWLSDMRWSQATYANLSSSFSKRNRSLFASIPVLRHPDLRRHRERASAGCSFFASWRQRINRYLLSGECIINVASYWPENLFYERILMARHAYNSILMLSKPGQPHVFNLQRYAKKCSFTNLMPNL